MKKAGLRTKLIFASMLALIIPMAVTIGVVTFIVTKQNKTTSFDMLKKSMDIIREDLQSKEKKLIADTTQLAGANKMGSKVQFLYEYKGNASMASVTENIYKEITNELFQVKKMSNLWQTAIYDADGDLASFAVSQGEDTFSLGYNQVADQTKLYLATLKGGEELTPAGFKQGELPSDSLLKQKFGKEIPQKITVSFEIINNHICLVTYSPILWNNFNKQTGQLEQKQFGFVLAVLRIEKDFVEKMSTLTGMKVNVFTKENLSVGVFPAYNRLSSVPAGEEKGPREMAKQAVLLSDVDIGNDSYFQGVLPLYNKTGPIGSLAALYSKELAKANTRQLIWLLTTVDFGCILVFVPLAVFFANLLAKPIKKCVRLADDISEGDFSQKISVDSQDEIGALMGAFNKMTESLYQKAELAAAIASGDLSREVRLSSGRDMLGQVLAKMTSWLNEILVQVNENVDRTASGAALVSDSSQSLSQSASEQAASLAQITSSMTRLASQTKTNAENAGQANNLALSAKASALNGSGQMAEMTAAMKDINDSSREIARIIKAIDDIAFQTNLLALNAA
ncbi:MAG: methyl-accepting chemotaxis protein, partial [Deltaproteobacteria bacterium]|nr:methyl-accepting chemotaxis protein [Deltaproteobacteria bacterium]